MLNQTNMAFLFWVVRKSAFILVLIMTNSNMYTSAKINKNSFLGKLKQKYDEVNGTPGFHLVQISHTTSDTDLLAAKTSDQEYEWFNLEEADLRFEDFSMAISVAITEPTAYPTQFENCPNTLGFTAIISSKQVTCDVISIQTEDVGNLMCEKITTFGGETKKILYYCPEPCKFDCTLDPKSTQSSREPHFCKDDIDFERTIASRKVTCDIIRYQSEEVKDSLCETRIEYKGENKMIFSICPDVCGSECTPTMPPSQSCRDDEKFEGSTSDRRILKKGLRNFKEKIPMKKITCNLLSQQTIEEKNLLCPLPVQSNGKTKLISQYCPITCGTNCAPTINPTEAPTPIPTTSPTKAPTKSKTESPTKAPPDGTTSMCHDNNFFSTNIANRRTTCDVIRYEIPKVQKLLCDHVVKVNDNTSRPVKQFCPEACKHDCAPTNAPTPAPTEIPTKMPSTKRCSDNSEFKELFSGRQITCDILSRQIGSIKRLMCSKSVIKKGRSISFIKKERVQIGTECPISCGDNCEPTNPPTTAPTKAPIRVSPKSGPVRCIDDRNFQTEVSGTTFTCERLSKQADAMKNLLCSRLVFKTGCTKTCDSICFQLEPAKITSHSDLTKKALQSPTFFPITSPRQEILPIISITKETTGCPFRSDAVRIGKLEERYAASPSDIYGYAQREALHFVTELNLDPCGDDYFNLQRYVAALFYFSTGGDDWIKSENYLNNEHECQWTGIICNKQYEIVALDFGSNNLVGTLVEELQHLPRLRSINVHGNHLSGTFPNVYTKLSDLININIDNNSISGNLPYTIGNLQNLRFFDIDNNEFTGRLPGSLFTINSLEVLDIDHNMFSGKLTPAFGNLVNMKVLQMHNNNFSGNIPLAMRKMTSLNEWDLFGNNIRGKMPSGVCKLKIPYLKADSGGDSPKVKCQFRSCCSKNVEIHDVNEPMIEDFHAIFSAVLEDLWGD